MSLPPDQVLISADDHLDIHAMPPDVWASDYPHGDSTWPRSREALAESPLAQHGPEVLRKVTCENAARVYGFRM
jgi:predicted TIM-barrel fold metal-dependent hydrolase